MFWNKYPYTDMHELNLDWILSEIMKLHKDYDEFKAVNTITNAGAWDITKQYQAWTIVNDNNVGYISLKPVPAGVSISNTEYWGMIGDYANIIANLNARVSELEFLNNKKYIIIADSYGALGWTSGVVNELGLDAHIINNGGAGFIGAGGGSNWNDNIVDYAGTLTDEERRAFTDIIVMGGVNDYGYSAADIKVAVKTFINYCKTAFPRALVQVGVISYASGQVRPDITSALPNKVMPTYVDACGEAGGVYVDMFGVMHDTSFLQADGLHPNADGTRAIINAVKNYILGKQWGITTNRKAATVTITDQSPLLPDVQMHTSIEGACCNLICSGFTVLYSSPKTWGGDYTNIVNIGTIEDTRLQGIVDEDTASPTVCIPCVINTYIDADAAYKDIPAVLEFYNGYIAIGFRNIVGGAITPVVTSSYVIPPFSVTMPLTLC